MADLPFKMPEQAFDIEMLREPAERNRSDCQGWVFGLPPGITSRQWPLDPNSGYPLVHGFTLLLPEAYRCHGPEIVAFSFFATAAEQNDGGATPDDELREAVMGEQRPSDPQLATIWRAMDERHPRLFRMQDILGYEYAVLLLTRAEFEGPLCSPKPLVSSTHVGRGQPPTWMTVGSGRAYVDDCLPTEPGKPLEGQSYFQMFGEIPEKRFDWNRALSWTAREVDPNAGKVPEEHFGEPTKSGYQMPFYWQDGVFDASHYREQAWTKGHQRNHIGGTMRPIQSIPKMSPFYVEFEEEFGGYNFGGGNAQLDFRDMKFDWACG